MSASDIRPITMPKWGLSMTEGKVVAWLVDEGRTVNVGDELLDIETEKIANTFEALDGGVLRRKVAAVDDSLPIGALLGVLAPASVSDVDVDAYIAEFQANYVPPAVEEEAAGPRYEFLDVHGYRLRYTRTGEGAKTFVLVHGFGGDLDNWLFNVDALASAGTVYALDLPGHGESTKAVTAGSVEALAEDLCAFLTSLELSGVHLVGHSLGGAICLAAALAHRELVGALTLLAPAGLGPEINAQYLTDFVAGESRRDMKPVLQQLVADPELVNRTMIDDILKYKRLDGVGSALTAIAAGFVAGGKQSVALRGRLGELAVPVQVIWGAEDRIIPASQAEGLPAGVKATVLPGVGHLVQMEAASDVNRLLKG